VTDTQTHVIIGGGLAGAKAAAALRAEGFGGRVVLVAAEPRLPYERPPLSKSYLAGESPFADAQVHDEAYYGAHSIELLTGTEATAIDPAGRRVTLAGGRELAYDRLLLAPGAVPRRPPIPGVAGALTLRSVADADAIRAVVDGGGRLAVIGAGWIGSEVAATARGLGAEVTLIERGSSPLEAVLGAKLGAFFAHLHRAHGVELLTGAQIAAIGAGGVELAGGRMIGADAVVLGVGVAPDVALAAAAGIATDDGIAADALLRTSAPDVFVAGDAAAAEHPRYGRRVRTEHWDNAIAQGEAAARSMLGHGEPYAKLPYFFSDQYDLGLEYVGLHGPGDELVLRGSLEEARFQAYWLAADGSVTAAMHVNDWDAIDGIRTLVEEGGQLPAAA
jgi:3-phenylpropionate/trans-cinnamate dioxygenase ferredoxin reductase component